jgi:hypothetical protein
MQTFTPGQTMYVQATQRDILRGRRSGHRTVQSVRVVEVWEHVTFTDGLFRIFRVDGR